MKKRYKVAKCDEGGDIKTWDVIDTHTGRVVYQSRPSKRDAQSLADRLHEQAQAQTEHCVRREVEPVVPVWELSIGQFQWRCRMALGQAVVEFRKGESDWGEIGFVFSTDDPIKALEAVTKLGGVKLAAKYQRARWRRAAHPGQSSSR